MKRIPIALLMPVLTSSAWAQTQIKAGVLPGFSTPQGLGQFADPTVFHGLTMGLQAGVGAADKSNSFGYDSVTVSLRYNIPSPNEIGSRITLMTGVANWYTPPLARIYPAASLTADERAGGATNVSTLMAGMMFRLFGDRDPSPDRNPDLWKKAPEAPDADWVSKHPGASPDTYSMQDWLQYRDLQITRLMIQNKTADAAELVKKRDAKLWLSVGRPALRKPTASLGALVRGGVAGKSGPAFAVDMYAAAAVGAGVLDVAAVFHHLRGWSDEVLLDHASIGTLGVFLDLSDAPPPSVMGLSASWGAYGYIPHGVTPDNARAPTTHRIDLVLSFSLASPSGDQSNGIGFKYSHITNEFTGDENQYALIFSSGGKFLQ